MWAIIAILRRTIKRRCNIVGCIVMESLILLINIFGFLLWIFKLTCYGGWKWLIVIGVIVFWLLLWLVLVVELHLVERVLSISHINWHSIWFCGLIMNRLNLMGFSLFRHLFALILQLLIGILNILIEFHVLTFFLLGTILVIFI
jgi:hypothetical protein